MGDPAVLLDGPSCGEATLGHESDYTILPAQTMAVGNSVGTQLAPRGREASPNASAYDAAVLQLNIGHIGMRRGATSDAGRSVQIRAQAQERSVRRRVDLDTFGHVFQVAPSIPRRARKQSVVPRQGIMVAVFRIVPRIDIKFLGEFRVQTLQMAEASGCRGCRPFDHVPVIT